MKQLYLTLLLVMAGLLAGIQTVKAQKVVLHMKGGKTFECSLSQLDSITFMEDVELCTQMGSDAECSLFYEAMCATGLCELLTQSRKDESWDYRRYLSCEKEYSLPSSSLYCHIPRTRETGVTVFACTNDALSSRYGIHNLQELRNYALSVYGGSADEAIRKLLSYCIIDRKSTLERLTTPCSIDTLLSVPTEWYSTLLPHSLLKVSRNMGQTFLNLSDNKQGICISEPQCNNICGNGSYFLTDGLPLYDEVCKQAFASERMRMDFYTLIPELENVMVRSSASYCIPHDYLHCLSASADTYIIYEGMHEISPFYEGDCLWLSGRYDVTFTLPAVPKQGTYEVRVGYTAMPNSGIAQLYFGSETQNMPPIGIPISFNRDAKANGLPWIPLSDADEEEELNSRRAIRNHGFMHGPASVCYTSEPNTSKRFCNDSRTLRAIILRQALEEDTPYYLRFKSVVEGDRPICLDYIELVHKDVYDNAETPEDIY